jgi:hypothetical protein
MTDNADEPAIDYSDLQPPPPIPEDFRLLLVAMEIKRYRDNYEADNPKEREQDDDIHQESVDA